MRPMIDQLELSQVQVIDTRDRRALAEHLPPGLDGSLLQNLGRDPTRVALRGIASGAGARRFIEQLDEKFRSARPVSFTADIVATNEIEEVMIEDFRVQEFAGKPDRFAYGLLLHEYIEPVEPEDASVLDGDILDDARGLMDDLVDGLDLGLDFDTGLERFVSPLRGLLDRLRRTGGSAGASGDG